MTDKPIFDAIRERKGEPLTQVEVDTVNVIMYGAKSAAPANVVALPWGARVTSSFRDKVRAISARLGCDPADLMACMAWESGRTFSPSVRNAVGSGATGLIQFMPATALSLGTTVDKLAAMTAEAQLDWVEKYFQPYKGRLSSLADLYMAILWPAAVGKAMEYVLWNKLTKPTTYRQNAGLDANKDGVITKAECSAKLYAMKAEGQRPENLG